MERAFRFLTAPTVTCNLSFISMLLESSPSLLAERLPVAVPTTRRGAAMPIALALAALTIIVFGRVVTFDFVPVDDGKYVYDNLRIQQGLTADNLRWAWTTGYFAIWHPLTWCSYLLDGQLFQAWPRPMHAVNLLLHLTNTLLLFRVLRRMTGDVWSSAFVAAMFGLHPLQVEPVAWISSRKDVLYTLFWMLSLGAYARYVERPSWRRYLPLALWIALGLTAKAAMVTLPCVLLLLDVWPLRRFDACGQGVWRRGLQLMLEKIPLFALSLMAAVLSHAAAQQGGALANNIALEGKMRAAQAVMNYAAYLGKAVWPTGLSVFYTHPATLGAAELHTWYQQAIGAAAALVVITLLVLRTTPRHRYLGVGWFWFLGTLVPVIGLIQVGSHARADRYTYVPLIGLAIMAAWGVPDLLRNVSRRVVWPTLLGISAVAACLTLTWQQVGCWQNGVTLGRHMVAVNPKNYQAHGILAFALSYAGRSDEALTHSLRSIELAPANSQFAQNMHNHVGIVYTMAGKYAAAEQHLRAALAIDPLFPAAHLNLGKLHAAQGNLEAAKTEFSETLRLQPDNAGAHYHLGLALLKQDQRTAAERHFDAALKLDPSYALEISKAKGRPSLA